jgi:hypothetical protein
MDSITIKTYLMDFIFDILDNPKFQSIFVPSENSSKREKIQLKQISENNTVFCVFESFMVRPMGLIEDLHDESLAVVVH